MKKTLLHAIIIAMGVVVTALSAADVSQLTHFPSSADESSKPSEYMVWNGKWVFAADSLVYGRELWSCDLDGGNRQLLYDAAPGSADGSPEELTLHQGELWFHAYDAKKNSMLCKIAQDGTAQQLVLIDQSERGTEVRYLTPAGDKMFFKAYYRSSNHTELWVSEGEGATTRKVVDVAWDDIGLETTLVSIGDKVLYLNHVGNFLNPATWISDGTAQGTQQYHSGERYDFKSYIKKDAFSYVTAHTMTPGKISLVRLAADGTAPVKVGEVSLPTGIDWEIRLRALHGSTLFFDVRVYRNYPWTYQLGRFQLSDGTVEYFPAAVGNDVPNPNDISPDGYWYFLQPNESGVLKRMGQTGPVETVHSFVNQTIQSVHAQTGSVVLTLQWFDFQQTPSTRYEWSVRMLDFQTNEVIESLWGSGRLDEEAAREYRLHFQMGYDALEDRYVVSMPLENQGVEPVFISDGVEPRAVNINRQQDQSAIYTHLLLGDVLYFARKNPQGDSELWRCEGSLSAELLTTLPELQRSRSVVFHPVGAGILVSWLDRQAKERMTYFNGGSSGGTEVSGLPTGGGNSHRTEKAMFQNGAYLLLKWETLENPMGLWSFDATTQTLTSLASRFSLPVGSDVRVSHRVGNHVYLFSEINDGSGVWQKNGYWRSDGTLTGTQQITEFPTHAIAWKQNVIELDQGQITLRDANLGESVLLATLPYSNERREMVDAKEMNGVLYFGIMPTSGGWLESVWQTDGTPAGTKMAYIYPYNFSSMQAGKRFLVSNTGQGLFFYRGEYLLNTLIEATADGVEFESIQQVVVSDLAVYFVAVTKDHGDAIFVSYGTQASTFLLYDSVVGSGTRLPFLLEATSRQLAFRQADENGAAQVYALPWPEHRISAEWDTWDGELSGLRFEEKEDLLWVNVTRTREASGNSLEWRITGEDAIHFSIEKEIDDGAGKSGILSRVPIRFRPQTLELVDAMVEVYVRGEIAPLMRFRVQGQYSPAPVAMTINGHDPQSDDFYRYSMPAWGWNVKVSPTEFQKRSIKKIEFYLNGEIVKQGVNFTQRLTPTAPGMNQLTVKGYDSDGGLILFIEQYIFSDVGNALPPLANRNYHAAFGDDYNYQNQLGELHIRESKSGGFTVRLSFAGNVFRERGSFNKRGLAKVTVRKMHGETLHLILERRYLYGDIPIVRAILMDGNFTAGSLQPKDVFTQFDALGNDRIERNEPHLAPGQYHGLAYESEDASGAAGILSVHVAADGSCRTKGTWLNGRRFTHAAHQPRLYPYAIFLASSRPYEVAVMDVMISEIQDTDHELRGRRQKAMQSSDSIEYSSLEGVIERYDKSTAAEVVAEDFSQKQWYWGRAAWAGEEEIVIPISEWRTRSYGYESQVPFMQALIDVNRGTARLKAKSPDAFLGTALYFPSQRKFIGTEESHAKGRMWELGPEE